MANYPIKLLKDESGAPFVPLSSFNSIVDSNNKSLQEKLDDKLESSNIVAGNNVTLTKDGNNIVINSSASGTANVVINNLTTAEANVGVLDAYQGYVLNNKISEMATTLEGGIPKVINNCTTTDTTNALSAYQGYLLDSKFNNYLPLKGGEITGDLEITGRVSNSNLPERRYFNIHQQWYCFGKFHSSQKGEYMIIKVYTGLGYNGAMSQQRQFHIHIRASNGVANDAGTWFGGHVDNFSFYGDSPSIYLKTLNSNECEVWMAPFDYSGFSFFVVEQSMDCSFTFQGTTSSTEPSNVDLLTVKNFVSKDWNGAYDSSGLSNLAYCNKGAFGTMATKNSGDYLLLSGGTMTSSAQIARSGASKSWYQGRDGALLKTTSYTGYNPISSLKTKDGDWSMGVYEDNKLWFTYISDTNYNSSINDPIARISIGANGGMARTSLNTTSANIPGVYISSSAPTAAQTGDIWFVT